MRIAQISPLVESVPPKRYGGTERVVSYLTDELARRGHDVTLFASGDSQTIAKLVPCSPASLRSSGKITEPLIYNYLMLEKVYGQLSEFDLLHFHIDYLHYPVSRRLNIAHLTTLHGRLDIPELQALYEEFSEIPLVSISSAQRKPIPWARWLGTIHHGLPENLYVPHKTHGKYLAFLGRISPEKGVDLAIRVAIAAGIEIRIAAKVDRADATYFQQFIKPLLSHPLVTFIGEIDDKEKNEFLGNALALLFPINWEEPFGLVMIEAMACGTPVIARPMGSVPEVIRPGINGFLFSDETEALSLISQLEHFDRRRCRLEFERRFTVERMADHYLEVYEQLISIPFKVAKAR